MFVFKNLLENKDNSWKQFSLGRYASICEYYTDMSSLAAKVGNIEFYAECEIKCISEYV